MTKEDIIRMAREAGFESHDAIINYPKELQRFAALVAAAEREACAKVCENYPDSIYVWTDVKAKFADAIRARRKQ